MTFTHEQYLALHIVWVGFGSDYGELSVVVVRGTNQADVEGWRDQMK